MTAPIRLAMIGLGKIAKDQHLPAIAPIRQFDLVAAVDPQVDPAGDLPCFRSMEELIASDMAIDAVSICTPPQGRRSIAEIAINQGWHVFLEKPPCATLAEVAMLKGLAEEKGVSLLASWHSRYARGVEPARAWLSGRRIDKATITWREDVRQWHPGQDWIFAAGGFGVFDPGINALSIATRILPQPIFVESAEVDVPGNRAAPIAARVNFRDGKGAPIAMELDFRQTGPQSWDIVVQTDAGTLILSNGGAALAIAGECQAAQSDGLQHEYPALYSRFAAVIRAMVSDVDVGPLRLVADTFLRAEFNRVEDFDW